MAGTIHPKLRHFPWHKDYQEMGSAFRPMVMYIPEPNYRSRSVNTSSIGLREQYDQNGDYIDILEVEKKHKRCNVLVGGSTVFGVDATSDRSTISSYLHGSGVPCLNLGMRGASSQMETALFLIFKQHLPVVDNIVILSGVNNPSMASLPDTVFYPEFGAIFSEPEIFDLHIDQYRRMSLSSTLKAGVRLHEWVNLVYRKFALFRVPFRYFFGRGLSSVKRPVIAEKEKQALMLSHLENDIDTWASVNKGIKGRVHYILQPVIGWTKKSLTHIEDECFSEDKKLFPSMTSWANHNFYEEYKCQISKVCRSLEIDFHDANEWLNKSEYCGKEIFTDVCHLTDFGYETMAKLIKRKLDWVS